MAWKSVTNMAAALSASSAELTAANTSLGLGRSVAALFSSARLNIMNSAAGTPFPETSATVRPTRPSARSVTSKKSPPTSLAGSMLPNIW